MGFPMVEAGGKGMGGGGGAIIGGKGVAEGPAASPTNRIAGIVDVDHASRRHVWLAVAYAVAVVTRDAGHATLTLPSTDRSPHLVTCAYAILRGVWLVSARVWARCNVKIPTWRTGPA